MFSDLSLLATASSHEPVEESIEAQTELEAEVLTEVAAEVVTVEVIQNFECLSPGKNIAGHLRSNL